MWLSRLMWWRPPCLLKVVIVNLQDDPSTALRGVLWDARGPWLTLRNTSLLKPNVPPVSLDGEAVIHRSNVSFLQVVP